MGGEAYFVAPDACPRRSVSDHVQQLTATGYPCREEADEWGHWVVFDGLESTLNFTVEEGVAVFATFEMAVMNDPPELFDAVERAFAEAGWETGPVEEG
ncbi:hypothetical protein SAMN05444166_2820 [Singulisphaera sp. GP187]|uniref:hypothetical protein n=1 Tax=Singulisphaera sp. GP187 TaxID=1882752 RepID=UPI000927D9B9|nr:hypothetical protein [Singulisphaera sp. GP187]SIO17317.1 hypothetical protein SAMN05444166_2820 [Singulisphaera sp. GP187]